MFANLVDNFRFTSKSVLSYEFIPIYSIINRACLFVRKCIHAWANLLKANPVCANCEYEWYSISKSNFGWCIRLFICYDYFEFSGNQISQVFFSFYVEQRGFPSIHEGIKPGKVSRSLFHTRMHFFTLSDSCFKTLVFDTFQILSTLYIKILIPA